MRGNSVLMKNRLKVWKSCDAESKEEKVYSKYFSAHVIEFANWISLATNAYLRKETQMMDLFVLSYSSITYLIRIGQTFNPLNLY